MKELQEIKQDNLVVSAEIPIKKELTYLGSLKPQNGLTCYELNYRTGEMTIATLEIQELVFNPNKKGVGIVRRKLLVRDNCIYQMALNEDNAKRKFGKILKGFLK